MIDDNTEPMAETTAENFERQARRAISREVGAVLIIVADGDDMIEIVTSRLTPDTIRSILIDAAASVSKDINGGLVE